jgi:hypothetical protein
MIHANPGDTITPTAIGFATGLTGTLGLTILDSAGAIVTARSTASIVETPTGDHGDPLYTATRSAPDDAGDYQLYWDDGAGNEAYEDLTVDFDEPPSGSAFATAVDLEARLGITFTAAEETRAAALLQIATGLIQDEAKQTVLLVSGDVLTMKGTSDERIVLPERPVVSVASVQLDSTVLAAGTDWFVDGNELVRVPSTTIFAVSQMLDAGISFPMGTGFGWEKQTLTITYTHGYAADEVPAVCKAVCLEAVARCFVNPGAVARESIGDTSTVYDNNRFAPSGLLLNQDERQTIRRFFGRRARSVTIGAGP